MVYPLALLHAIPDLVVGLAFKSRSKTIYAAIGCAGVGVMIADPIYIMIDVIAVGLASWFCFANFDTSMGERELDEPDSRFRWVSSDDNAVPKKREHREQKTPAQSQISGLRRCRRS